MRHLAVHPAASVRVGTRHAADIGSFAHTRAGGN